MPPPIPGACFPPSPLVLASKNMFPGCRREFEQQAGKWSVSTPVVRTLTSPEQMRTPTQHVHCRKYGTSSSQRYILKPWPNPDWFAAPVPPARAFLHQPIASRDTQNRFTAHASSYWKGTQQMIEQAGVLFSRFQLFCKCKIFSCIFSHLVLGRTPASWHRHITAACILS